MPLSVVRLDITQFLGIEYLSVEFGQLTKALGPNGCGKTSLIEAIKTIHGGSPAKLIRDGSDSAQTVFLLSNGWKIRNKFRRGKTTEREILTAEGGVIRSPASWVDARLNPDSFDAIRFANAKSKDLIDQLLKVSKLKLSRHEFLEAISGCEVPEILLAGGNSEDIGDPLGLVDLAYDKIYDQRKGTNAVLKERKGYASTLESKIQGRNMEVPQEPAEFREELARVQAEQQNERERVLAWSAETKNGYIAEFNAIEKEAADARDRKIAQAKAEYEHAIVLARQEKDLRLDKNREQSLAALDAVQAKYGPKIAKLNEQTTIAEHEIREYDRWTQDRQDFLEAVRGRDDYERKSKAETEALNALKSLKAKMMESLPVPGLSIQDGELRYDGHLFETTNSAKRYEIALQIALAAANPELPLIYMDQIEAMDAESMQIVEAWAKSHPEAQIVLAGVCQPEYDEDGELITDKTLRIETSEASTAVRRA